jgi:predicted O-methyltransferase YrrM
LKNAVRKVLLDYAGKGRCVTLPYALYRLIPESAWKASRFGALARCDERAAAELLNALGTRVENTNLDLSNSGVLNPLALLAVTNLLWHTKPRTIVEMGVGASTLWLAAHAARCQEALGHPPQIFCVEHDEQWIATTRKRLEAAGLALFTTIIHAPLVKQTMSGLTFVSYSKDALASHISPRSVDFLLIDGPPGYASGHPGRMGCLPVLSTLLKSGADVVLDDARRVGETSALRIWQSAFPGSIRGIRGWVTTDGQVSFRWGGCRYEERGVPARIARMKRI